MLDTREFIRTTPD